MKPTSDEKTALHSDAALIDNLGGSAVVARLIGLDTKAGGVQRVDNWKRRGIPAEMRLKHLGVFGLPRANHEKAA